jgi:isopentenyl-diphosphate delta-isomerase
MDRLRTISAIEPSVELVDASGAAVGQIAKGRAHLGSGRLHRAFSVLLIDPEGRLLIQRRASTKYHSGGLWSNTCCGHPAPGELPLGAAVRRLREELGAIVGPHDLEPAGTVTYRVEDEVSGLIEHEFNHLFVGHAPQSLSPNPDEVSDVQLVELGGVGPPRDLERYSAWFAVVLQAARPALARLLTGPSRLARSSA